MVAMGTASMLAGCAESRNVSNGGSSSGSTETIESQASTSGTSVAQGETKSLVLVFSRAGENYSVGTVEVGNTMVLAQMIADKTGGDLFELERAEPYSSSYSECCDEALEESNTGTRPTLKALPDLSSYDTVFLGFPCWWGDIPMPVYTAIEALDWNGKTIYPFSTHAGSGEAGMFTTVEEKCTGAIVGNGLTMSGVTAQNERAEAESQVDAWLASMD